MPDLASAEGPKCGGAFPLPGQGAARPMPRDKKKRKTKKRGGISASHSANLSLLASESEKLHFAVRSRIERLPCTMAEKVAARDVENTLDVSVLLYDRIGFEVHCVEVN